MKRFMLVALSSAMVLGCAGSAFAQNQTAPAAETTATQNPAVKSTKDMTGAPLADGQNSFTKAQAKARILSAGYSHVTGLVKDANGLWQARARQHGKSVHVALDYKGNVASN